MSRFFLLTKTEDGKLAEFVGPVLQDDLEEITLNEFDEDDKVETLDETMFKILYFEEYLNDFAHNWPDYISTLLDDNDIEHDIVSDYESDEDDEDDYNFETNNEVILIYNFGSIYFQDGKLLFHIQLDSNPVDVSKLSMELSKYIEFCDFEIDEKVFVDDTGQEFIGDEADYVFEINKFYSLNLN